MKKVLGKGLSALIPDSYARNEEREKVEQPAGSVTMRVLDNLKIPQGVQTLPLGHIQANEDQPRKNFSAEGIDELAASIKEKGIMQPIIVKKVAEQSYMIICGERRFRAAKLCGLEEVPVVIKDIADADVFEWAIIENIQREDLNPLEEARAYQRLSEERALSQDEVAKRVGKDRSTIANMLRLLRLPEDIHQHIANEELTAGHARALLGLLTPEHQRQLARKIVEEGLSVRQAEALVTRSSGQKRRARKARQISPEILDLENRLEQHLGTQVKLHTKKNKKSGRIEIQYYSLDDLDRVLEKLRVPKS